MINPDIFLKLALTSEGAPALFPFPFSLHIAFSIIALIFFVMRFIMEKKPFHLIMAVAVPFSLTVWISDSRTWFYTLGLIELVLLISALITSIIFKDKTKENKDNAEKEPADEVQE